MGIKIALISDIHGNSSALKAVLDEIRTVDGLEHIYCLGDMIGVGHESNEVLEQLTDLDNCSFVRGNHDHEIIRILQGDANEEDALIDHHIWLAERIDPKFHSFLLNLPYKVNTEHGKKKCLFAHYRFDEKGRFEPSDPEPTIKKLDGYYKHEDAQIICFGHRHMVHFFQSGNRFYINPGPVGLDNMGPSAKYCLIEIEDHVNAAFKEVSYDYHKYLNFIHNFEKLKVPCREAIVKSCYVILKN